MFDPIEEIARAVAGIERLDQERDARFRRRFGRAGEIADEDSLRRRTLFRRNTSGEAMDRAAADGDGIIKRALECIVPFTLAPGNGGKTGLAFATGWRIDAELGQAMPRQFRFHGRGRNVIGKQQLDRAKPRRRRGAETLEQRALGEQISEIGGEAGHGVFFRVAGRALNVCYWLSITFCSLVIPGRGHEPRTVTTDIDRHGYRMHRS